MEKEELVSLEDFVNAHVFIHLAMIQRGLDHPDEPEDELDKHAMWIVEEYPKPFHPALSELKEAKPEVTLKEFLEILPTTFQVEENPPHIYLVGRIVNEGVSPVGHDIDILVKQKYPDLRIIANFLRAIPKKYWGKIQFTFDPLGASIGHCIPIYRLAFNRMEIEYPSHLEEMKEKRIELFKPFRQLKAQSGLKKYEFWDSREAWDRWASLHIGNTLFIQKKYDGFRFQVHVDKTKRKVAIITEDKHRDRSKFFPNAIEELLKNLKADKVILDVEMVEYEEKCRDVIDKEDLCNQVPREDMVYWITAEDKRVERVDGSIKILDDRNVVFHVHDLLYLDEEGSLQDLPYEERWELLNQVLPKKLKYWRIVKSKKATNLREYLNAVRELRSIKNSEGVMIKDAKSVYKLTGRTKDWCKIKNEKEVDVIVVDMHKVKGTKNTYNLICAFRIPCNKRDEFNLDTLVEMNGKCYSIIGRTYNIKGDFKVGDIVEIRTIRIDRVETKKGVKYTWMFPKFIRKRTDKKEADPLEIIDRLVKVGSGYIKERIETSELNEKLFICPYWYNKSICVLARRIYLPRPLIEEIQRKELEELKGLRFPVKCLLASMYRCPYLKDYYYEEGK